MIRLPKTIAFTFPSASYVDWTITSNNSTVILDKTSGRSSAGSFNISLDVQFPTSDIIASTILTVRGEDNNGCIQTGTITFTDPCSTLNTTIASGGTWNAVVTVTGGVAPYTIQWSYDSSKFVASSTNTASITLTPINPADINLATTSVYVQVTDSNGCVVNDSYSIAIPQITLLDRYYSVATCFENVLTWTLYLENNAGFDKSYVEVLNEDITATWESNGFLKFTVPATVDYDFEHDLKLRTTTGLYKQTEVQVAVNLCNDQNPSIPTLRVQQEIGASAISDTKTYTLSDNGNIDYSNFEFVPSSGQSVAGGILTTAIGTAELLPSRQIQYTVGSVGFDRVRFKATDMEGNPTDHVDLFIDPYNYPTPTASDFSLDASVGALTEADLSSYFTGDVRSFTVVTAPTKGTLSFSGTTLRYLPTTSGTDTLEFTARGLNGVESATVTVTFNIVSSGTAIAGTVCTNGNIDLTSLLVSYTAGGTWTQTSGTSVSLVDPTSVSYSGKPSGYYTFNYAVGTTSTDVTVEHRVYTISSTSNSFSGDYIRNYFGCSSDITLDLLSAKVYRNISGSPTVPDDYYETVPLNSLVTGTAQLIYTPDCPAQHRVELYVNGICGETLLDTSGIFAC